MAERTSFPRWVFRIAVVGAAILVVYLGVIATQVIRASNLDQRESVDAIVVLGAAQYDGTPSPAFQRRLDRALELYQDGLADEIVLTGAKQPADRFTEAFSGFKYLVRKGVPESDLRIVDDGESTYESLAAARRVLRDEGSDRVLLVSDGYHNRRLQGISRELGMEAFVAPTDGSATISQIIGETGRVAVAEIIGYRRLFNATA